MQNESNESKKMETEHIEEPDQVEYYTLMCPKQHSLIFRTRAMRSSNQENTNDMFKCYGKTCKSTVNYSRGVWACS
jgi:hypothetical protein